MKGDALNQSKSLDGIDSKFTLFTLSEQNYLSFTRITLFHAGTFTYTLILPPIRNEHSKSFFPDHYNTHTHLHTLEHEIHRMVYPQLGESRDNLAPPLHFTSRIFTFSFLRSFCFCQAGCSYTRRISRAPISPGPISSNATGVKLLNKRYTLEQPPKLYPTETRR